MLLRVRYTTYLFLQCEVIVEKVRRDYYLINTDYHKRANVLVS